MEVEVKSEHLITNSSRMMNEILNENNQLIDRASEAVCFYFLLNYNEYIP